MMKTCKVQIQSKTVISRIQQYVTFRQRMNKKRYINLIINKIHTFANTIRHERLPFTNTE